MAMNYDPMRNPGMAARQELRQMYGGGTGRNFARQVMQSARQGGFNMMDPGAGPWERTASAHPWQGGGVQFDASRLSPTTLAFLQNPAAARVSAVNVRRAQRGMQPNMTMQSLAGLARPGTPLARILNRRLRGDIAPAY